MQLAEESATYNLNQVEKKYSHDKLIKNILQDKKEATQFINQFIEPREKAERTKELVENLEIMIQSTQNEKILKELVNIISYLLENVLEKEIQQKLLAKIERKVGEKDMDRLEYLIQNMKEDRRRDIQQGKEASKRIIAKNMLNKKLDEKIILETTELKKEELEKIKKELAVAG